MPIIKSARKRVKTARKATARNVRTKRSLKSALKLLQNTPSDKAFNSAQSNLDKAVKKGVIHKNKAARLKKKAASVRGVKPSTKSSAKSKNTATKPAAAKKSTSKSS